MSDEEAVQRIQEGEPDAFGRLMGEHLSRLRAFVALRVPRAHLVDEIVHDAFVYAYLNIQKYRRGASVHGWLRAIAQNLIRAETLRYARERANRDRYSRSRGTEARPSAVAELDLAGLEDSGAENLLHMKYALGFGASEIARRVGRSPGWVRSALFRLREKLRRRTVPDLA